FRRLPRPSSPLTAKASTVDAYSLDHITRSCLQITDQLSIFRLIASTTHLNSVRVQTLVTSQVVKEHQQDLNVLPVSNSLVCAVISRTGGADRDRTGDPLLAKQVLSQLSYSPVFYQNGIARSAIITPPRPLAGEGTG